MKMKNECRKECERKPVREDVRCGAVLDGLSQGFENPFKPVWCSRSQHTRRNKWRRNYGTKRACNERVIKPFQKSFLP